MAAKPTRRDVAALANVSGTTVSRVLGGRADASISPRARESVLRAARELGYTPNSAAKALRAGRTGLIGFWMCMGYSRYRAAVLAHLRDLLKTTEFALAVTDVDEEYAWHHSFDRALRVPVDGIIAFDAAIAGEAFAADADRLAPNLPFVSMGAFWSEARSYVGVDLTAGAVAAVEHLVETGRRRIAYAAPRDLPFANGEARAKGYAEAIAAAGRTPIAIEIDDRPEFRIASIEAELARLRAEGALPDALVCFYDDMAVDAVLALERLGLRAGADVALVGFNGSEGTDRGPCPITTVRQPVEAMCALAYEFLKAQIDDPRAPLGKRVLLPELVVRASSLPA